MAELRAKILGLRGAELERWLDAVKRFRTRVSLELSSRIA